MKKALSLMALVIALGVVGCGGGGTGGNKSRSMSRSSGEFSSGRKDGLADAKNAWFDQHGGWMWLWMKSAEYRTGYEQGWNEGRHMKSYKSHQQRAKTATDPDKPAPPPDGD